MTLLPRIRRPQAAAALAVASLVVAAAGQAAPATAVAARSLGTTTIALDGPLADTLRSDDVTIAVAAPARGGARRLVLPVSGGTVQHGATLSHGGRVTLRSGRRVLTLARWEMRVEGGRATLSAAFGNRRRAVLAAVVPARRLALDSTSGSVRVQPVALRLTRAGARLVRAQLALDGLRAGLLGTLQVAATVGGTGGGGTGSGTRDGGSGGGVGSPPPGCTPGYGSGPITPAPAPLARPAGAANVTAATLTWRPRPSFIQYVATGEGASASDGATPGPPETVAGNSARLVYSFDFALKPGSWYDTPSGTAGLLAQGTIRFQYSGHGIEITVKDPEIELNGSSSRVIFTFLGRDCTLITSVRGVMLSLAPRAPSTTGSTRDYGPIAAAITEVGSSMFSGFYLPSDPWGSIAVSLTTGP